MTSEIIINKYKNNYKPLINMLSQISIALRIIFIFEYAILWKNIWQKINILIKDFSGFTLNLKQKIVEVSPKLKVALEK